jgi:hypothetical protein
LAQAWARGIYSRPIKKFSLGNSYFKRASRIDYWKDQESKFGLSTMANGKTFEERNMIRGERNIFPPQTNSGR